MAVDMFLKMDGISGESSDSKHKGEIVVLGWMWRGNHFGSIHAASGGGSGRPSFDDLVLRKPVDKSSPNLFSAMCKGNHIKECVFVVRKAGGKKPVEYIKFTMNDCIISSVVMGGEGGADGLFEQFSINFAKFKLEYVPQKQDGSAAPGIKMGFDIAKLVAE